jgi:hypothetical protein
MPDRQLIDHFIDWLKDNTKQSFFVGLADDGRYVAVNFSQVAAVKDATAHASAGLQQQSPAMAGKPIKP